MQKIARKLWVHQVRVTDGELREGESVLTTVDPEWRLGARQAHSATHLCTPRCGSCSGRTRCRPARTTSPATCGSTSPGTRGLSAEPAREIEEVANRAVRKDLPVAAPRRHVPRPRPGARSRCSARSTARRSGSSRSAARGRSSSAVAPTSTLRADRPGGAARRVVGRFRASVGSRPTSGIDAFSHLATERALVANLSGMLKVPAKELPGRVEQLVERLRVAEKELEKVRAADVLSSAAALVDSATEVGGTAAGRGHQRPDGIPAADLRALAADVRGRLGGRPAVVALFATERRRGVVRRRRHHGRRRRPGSRPAIWSRRSCRRSTGAAAAGPTSPRAAEPDPAGSTPRSPRSWRPSPTSGRRRGRASGDPAGCRPARRGVRLGVDVGSVRVGVAVSDPHGILATPVTTCRGTPSAAPAGTAAAPAVARHRPARRAGRRARRRGGGRGTAPHSARHRRPRRRRRQGVRRSAGRGGSRACRWSTPTSG